MVGNSQQFLPQSQISVLYDPPPPAPSKTLTPSSRKVALLVCFLSSRFRISGEGTFSLRAGRGSLRSGSLLVKTDVFSATSYGGEMGTMESSGAGKDSLHRR